MDDNRGELSSADRDIENDGMEFDELGSHDHDSATSQKASTLLEKKGLASAFEEINDEDTTISCEESLENCDYGKKIDERLANIEMAVDAGVAQILNGFEAKIAYDSTKQDQIDRLHEELQKYREDIVSRAARPLVNGMIRLYYDTGKLLFALQSKPHGELSPERYFSIMEGLQEDIEIVLGQNGITSYKGPSGPFDPKRQRVLKKTRTRDDALAGQVVESIRPGFEQGTEVIEKESVAIYEYVPEPDTKPEDGIADNPINALAESKTRD